MNDQLPTPPPDDSKSEDSEKKERNRALALDNLPTDVKEKLHALIALGKSYREIAYNLRLEFKGKNAELDNLLDSSDTAYRNYIEKHEEEILKLAADTKALTTDLKGGLADVKVVIDEMTNPTSPIENKKQALIALHERCEVRLRLLEARQGTKFLDPQYEQMIHTYIKDQEHIIETLISYSEELKKDGVNEFYKEFKSYTYAMLVLMNQCYKEIWGDEKFLDFHSELERRMDEHLVRWLQDRNVTLPADDQPKAG